MLSTIFIVGGYVALIATAGWPGVVAAAIHIAVMLAAVKR